ncbi:MAG: acyl-CoA synthetase FdrA [Clostridia bacterium]|nr:acyl-CoA synthetase FdrA [Clostridia bacterium]
MNKIIIKENLFLDSVFSMTAAKELKKIEGVRRATLVMGTDLNKTVLAELGALSPEAQAAGPNTLIIALDVDEEGLEQAAEKRLEELLAGSKENNSDDKKTEYKSSDAAYDAIPETNLVVISVAGEYAGEEARKALEHGANVFIFSDNVPLEDEVELKQLARDKGLLVMGPGCGTAVIGGVSVGMMSKVSRGRIGIVAASGSGLQEVAVLVDRAGEGISQAIGTGGRDLSKEVGGITMLQGIEYLKNDPETDVIVLISKPPHPETAEKICRTVSETKKPSVVYFLGGDRSEVEAYGLYSAASLEDAAMIAVALEKKQALSQDDFQDSIEKIYQAQASEEAAKISASQKYLRGLFCGGTHSEEAVLLLKKMVPELRSNIAFGGAIPLDDPQKSEGHCLVDLGDEVFTRGRPHPVIDPSVMIDRLIADGTDPETAVILFDLLLGHGCHEDPVGVILDALKEIRSKSEAEGCHICIVCDLCGSDKEPQNYSAQKKALEELGVIVFNSNSRAAIFAGMVIESKV